MMKWVQGPYVASLHFFRSPGKDLDKQRVVEHDQLIHEFERLTTDPDGLLGVLEETLHEHSDDTNFAAKRLLCTLFQVKLNSCSYSAVYLDSNKISTTGILQSLQASGIS